MLNQYPDFDVKHFGSTFTTGRLNGYDVMIMQSHEYTDKIIDAFKSYIRNGGQNINEYQTYIYNELNINLDKDILESDQLRIKEEIEKFYRIYNGI